MSKIKECIDKLVRREDLTEEQTAEAMEEVMGGQATPSQIAAFITALRMKGETAAEITGAARVMRRKARQIRVPGAKLIDTCGTGGDGAKTFNISTAAAFVVAGLGLPVAKHGNRAISSRCGSADVLEALGVKVDLEPEMVEYCLQEVGIGFMFAPGFNPAMRFAAGPRQEIGIRTIFNVLGPITNPAGAEIQLLGVYDPELARKVAYALHRLGCTSGYVVHGAGGLDELSLAGPNQLLRVSSQGVEELFLRAKEVGLTEAPNEALAGGDTAKNTQIILEVLTGKPGPARDVVILNAGAAITAAGRAKTILEGIKLAATTLDSGAAQHKLNHLIRVSQSLPREQRNLA